MQRLLKTINSLPTLKQFEVSTLKYDVCLLSL